MYLQFFFNQIDESDTEELIEIPNKGYVRRMPHFTCDDYVYLNDIEQKKKWFITFSFTMSIFKCL